MPVLDGWQHCPLCGDPVVVADGRATCARDGVVAYASSAPTVSALIVDAEGRLLLARRAVEPFRRLWDVPGGFLEEGEHPLDALVREIREETGLDAVPGAFFGVWMDVYGDGPGAQSTLNLYWEASASSGEPSPADDVAELRWFAADGLPRPDELAFTTVADALERWRSTRAC
jgi:ADP-ribose pyrophosphatase YjhB (NUDIX family)